MVYNHMDPGLAYSQLLPGQLLPGYCPHVANEAYSLLYLFNKYFWMCFNVDVINTEDQVNSKQTAQPSNWSLKSGTETNELNWTEDDL